MEEAIAGLSGLSLLDINTLKETFSFHWSAWKSIGKGKKSPNNLASQNNKKPEMKLLVTEQALGTFSVPADPASFQSGPPCATSFSQ